MMRAPQELRFVLATRHDVRLGLHRLRLEGELAEIRADDLRFSLAEARALFAGGRGRADRARRWSCWCDRTEGWAAGLRLAALSLAGHPGSGAVRGGVLRHRTDRGGVPAGRGAGAAAERRCGGCCCAPACWTGSTGSWPTCYRGQRRGAGAARFGGGQRVRGVAGRDAVLVPLPPAVRRPAAACSSGAPSRSEVTALHELAAGWFAEHGFAVEAVSHAQAARDWGLAARLLADHWPGSCTWTGRRPPSMSCSPGSPPKPPRRRCRARRAWPRPMSWRGGRWRRRSGTDRWPSAGRRGCRKAGAGRRGCCSGWSGCCWPGRVGAACAGPSRRSGCRPWPRPPRRPGNGHSMTWRLRCLAWPQELRALALVEHGRHRVVGGPARAGPAAPGPRVWPWRAGSGGRSSSPPAWRGRRRTSSPPGRLPRTAEQQQAGNRAWPARHGWTDETARPASAYIALGSVLAWQGRPEEAEPLGAARGALPPSDRKPSRWRSWRSATSAGYWKWPRGRDADALAAFRAARAAGRAAPR